MSQSLWLKKIENAISPSLDLPMWGNVPEFSFEEFSKQLGKTLSIQDLQITSSSADWKNASELRDLMKDLVVSAFLPSPITEPLFIGFSQEGIDKLCSWTASTGQTPTKFVDKNLEKGFLQFLQLQTLDVINQMSLFENINFHLSELHIAHSDAYVITVQIKKDNDFFSAWIICPTLFYDTFTKHFASHKPALIDYALSKSLHVPITFSAGHVDLNYEQLKSLEVGNFIILDHCTYHPIEKKGTLQMSIYDEKIMQAKIKDNEIKILDFIYTGEAFMENSEEPIEEGIENVENSELETNYEAIPNEPLTKMQNVPLQLHVEVSKVSMPLDQILKLKPGATINLSLSPEQGVYITVEGKKIAYGQLLQIGDAVGVKITELAK